METIETNGAYIELTDIGADDFPTLYAYTILYKGERKAGNINIPAHMIGNEEFVTASVATHAGLADEEIVRLTMELLGEALKNAESDVALGHLVLEGI